MPAGRQGRRPLALKNAARSRRRMRSSQIACRPEKMLTLNGAHTGTDTHFSRLRRSPIQLHLELAQYRIRKS
jgi:hypothetical protein